MANNFNDVLKAKEENERSQKRKSGADSAVMSLDDTQRVKVLSPGRLVAKRFLRNKLAIIGSLILILMFFFSFICPLFYAYGQTDIFYKFDHLAVKYAQATERLDYTNYSVDSDIEVHYSVRNMMTSNIKKMEAAGTNELEVSGSDGNSYTIARLGDRVYTVNTAAGSEIAVYSGFSSAGSYNAKIGAFSKIGDKGAEFKSAFTNAVDSKLSGFEADGDYYFIRNSLKNIFEALSLSSGKMSYHKGDLGEGFVTAFKKGLQAGSFEYNGKSYTITGDAASGFSISEAGTMKTVLVSSQYVFDAFSTDTVFTDEFKTQALMALYGGKAFTADGVKYTIAEKPEGYFILKDGAEYAILSTFVVRRYNGEDTLSLDFKAEAEKAIAEAREKGKTTAAFTIPLPQMDSEGNYLVDANGKYTTSDSEITATFKVDAWVLTCDQITHLIDIYAPPSSAHLFGTDNDGFDIVARMMYGGRISLMVGFVVVILESVLGIILGGLAGYFGRWVDSLIMRLVDIFYCIPTYPILIILGAYFDSVKLGSYMRLIWMMAVMGFLGWASVARLVRGQILSLREQEFMTAVEATGLTAERKIFRHLIPNVMPQLIVSATMGLGSVIITEATLSFLGLGVKHPLATWGTMINSITSSNENLIRYAHIWIPVGLLICLTVIAFNFVGDGLRDAFDPKMKQ
jgi:peptide/nickel transport system permease protein